MFNTKKLVAVVLVFALVFAFAACSKDGGEDTNTGSPTETNPESNPDNTTLKGSLTVSGSTSVQPVAEILAEAFKAKNPDVTIDVQGGGSGAGIKAVDEGASDIGMSSRELKDEELTKGFNEVVVAKDGIGIIVNTENAVKDLTMEQIKNIYNGTITNWSEVGGADGEIVVVNREAGSGTRDAFEELIMGEEDITDAAIVQTSTGAVKTTVQGDMNAIGFISLASVDETVTALKVDGVEATDENIVAGTYKISRPFLMLTKTADNELANAFFEFIKSEEGQKIITEEGLITVE